jgi:hypothetical protein
VYHAAGGRQPADRSIRGAEPPEHRPSAIAVRYWYFRPELKYLTCQARAEGDGRSVVELEEVACQHRILTS